MNVFHDLEFSDGLEVVIGDFAAKTTNQLSKELDPMLGDLVAVFSAPRLKPLTIRRSRKGSSTSRWSSKWGSA